MNWNVEAMAEYADTIIMAMAERIEELERRLDERDAENEKLRGDQIPDQMGKLIACMIASGFLGFDSDADNGED